MNSTDFIVWSMSKARKMKSEQVIASMTVEPSNPKNALSEFLVTFTTRFGDSAVLGTSYTKRSKNGPKVFKDQNEAMSAINAL